MCLKLDSKRLYILALSCDEVGLLAEDIASLEARLGLVYKGASLEGHLLNVTREQYNKITSDKENYLWHTFWMFILKDSKTIIGSACFKGTPDIDGAVEIGYGTNELFQNKGYTSEAVCSLCRWALTQAGVKSVIAETEKDNIPSQKVLEKNGFDVYHQTADSLWWRISAPCID